MTIGDDQERFFQVGARLPTQEREELVELLRGNADVFAWDAYEAPGLNPEFICHRLNVDPSVTPKKQPPRRPSNEHVEVIKSEVVKLKQAGAIKEIFYPQWLANTVVVKKKTGKWRVCVDFTDLNKACPKDPFPFWIHVKSSPYMWFCWFLGRFVFYLGSRDFMVSWLGFSSFFWVLEMEMREKNERNFRILWKKMRVILWFHGFSFSGVYLGFRRLEKDKKIEKALESDVSCVRTGILGWG